MRAFHLSALVFFLISIYLLFWLIFVLFYFCMLVLFKHRKKKKTKDLLFGCWLLRCQFCLLLFLFLLFRFICCFDCFLFLSLFVCLYFFSNIEKKQKISCFAFILFFFFFFLFFFWNRIHFLCCLYLLTLFPLNKLLLWKEKKHARKKERKMFPLFVVCFNKSILYLILYFHYVLNLDL